MLIILAFMVFYSKNGHHLPTVKEEKLLDLLYTYLRKSKIKLTLEKRAIFSN